MLCFTGFLFFVTTFFTCTFAVHVRSCNANTGRLVSVNWLNVSPDPIVLPGNLKLNASATLHEPVTGNLDADLTVSRRLGPMWIDLPCVLTSMGRLGSCTYTNICSTIMGNGTQCPSLLARNGIPCTCPVQAQTYTLLPTTIHLDLSTLNIPAVAVAGEYQASLRVTNKDTMTEIICLDFFVEIAAPETSNPFGSIGRFLVNLFG